MYLKSIYCLTACLLTQGVMASSQGLSRAVDDTLANGPYSPYADRSFPTQVYFGDTHVHTGLSGDAGGAGTTLLPRDTYRFARGEQVTSNTGQPVKLSRPLDFYVITDHSDGMGAIVDLLKGTPEILADEQGRQFHEDFNAGGTRAQQAAFRLSTLFSAGQLSPVLNYQPGNPAFNRVWEDMINAAEDFNDPGTFTTLIGFEWTSVFRDGNLHRNVILRDGGERAGKVVPYTTTPPAGSSNPRDLWAWMLNYEESTGGRVLAIPHNGNLSNGLMFSLKDDFAEGAPALDPNYAEARAKWEPLFEVTQVKGDSESHPGLSPNDEFANYETWDWGDLNLVAAKTPDMLPGEYARAGLKRGLALAADIGVNPYKFGLVGGTDTHTGLSTVQDDNFYGKYPAYEPNPVRATDHVAALNAKSGLGYDSWQYSSAGFTAIWARSNTREEIWDAMKRREVYTTTGPRMVVRLFGGWAFDETDTRRRDLARVGYAKGVPMGADLPPGDGTPSFLVAALRDPMGANLDRIQIVKGWLDENNEQREKVYDVVWSDDRKIDGEGKLPDVGNTVDLSIPSWTNAIGAAELVTVWTDPDFDATQSAFYYARVIEIPTPRWTAYDAVRFNLKLADEVQVITQERAYTSPIWYTPE
jgi:hypothetical protein